MTGNVSEAEDCTQEAFILAWNKLGKFRGDSAFSTWLHRIAVNAVLGRIRKSKREHDRIQAVADAEPQRTTADDTGETARPGRGDRPAARGRATRFRPACSVRLQP